MDGHLSNGLAPLGTSGNRIVDLATGDAILLRGVNRSGLEYAGPDDDGFLSGASLSQAEIEFIVNDWRANIIRLPFNQDFVLHGRAGRTSEEYQQTLDQVIAWAAQCGAYTLLDLQWLDADRIYGGNRNFVAPLPNADSLELWTMLARRYKDEPAVLYDLFNEPHDRLPDDPYPLNKPDGTTYSQHQKAVTMKEWQPWARALTQAVRAENPNALVFIAGTNWGYDLRGMPMDLENVVYSTHVYPNKGNNWGQVFGNLARSSPVFVGELGGSDSPTELAYVRSLLAYIQQQGLGFTAWSWFNEPFLVKREDADRNSARADGAARYTPTAFGHAVRQALTGA